MPAPFSHRFPDLAALRRWLGTMRQRPCWHDWRWQVRSALGAEELRTAGLLPERGACAAARQFPARVTPYVLDLTNLTDPSDRSDSPDPLATQWLPSAAELAPDDGIADPFAEARHAPVPGVIQRFSDRILVLVSALCATNCRHCTRRHTLGQQTLVRSAAQVRQVVAFLRASPQVREVILSGGDPLLLPDAALLRFVRALAALPQLDAIRIGTRAPVVLPMRVTPALARALGRSGRVWVNTQFNHVREITPESAAACRRLVEAGVPVSNQSVLLRGVNDSVEAMVALCAGLQRIRVRPYYVFVCDPVAGLGHLRTSRARARAIAHGVASRLGGLAVPRFVADVPGKPHKVPV
ncbi:MAG: KamA family radical SAM protein [Kiritimatiellia bacterium]